MMRYLKHLLFGGLILSIPLMSSHAQEAPPPPLAHPLDEQVPQWLIDYNIPGVAIALVENGEVVWVKGYGVANRETQTPVTGDTLFSIASLGKAFTVWGTMQLVQEGVLDLDAPIQQYLTRWQFKESPRFTGEGVTIRRILSHTAGLTTDGYRGTALGEPIPTIEELLGMVGQGVLIFKEPGTEFSYSGGGYLVLQLAIEEVTGQTFEAFITERVLTPLGITTSTVTWTESDSDRSATAYDEDEALAHLNHVAKASGGFYMSAQDLATFVAAHLTAEGQVAGRGLVTPENVDLSLSPAEATRDQYGFGYFIQVLPDGGRVDWHDGIQPGWRTMFALDQAKNDGLVVLTNSEQGYQLMTQVACLWAGDTRTEFCEQVKQFEG